MTGRTMKPVCVAGMHRSGTSMTAKLLRMAGLFLGADEDLATEAAADNPGGFLENRRFVALNDELLHALGGGWDCPVNLSAQMAAHPHLPPMKTRAAAIVATFAGRDPWGWKDPRNSVTLPFWQAVAGPLKVVCCLRHPLEVAGSLRKRNYFSESLSLGLWQTYNEQLLQATAPGDRLVTHYAAYFDDPRAELTRLFAFAGLEVPADAFDACLAAIAERLRHHHFTSGDLVEAAVAPDVAALYERLCIEAGRPQEAARTSAVADTAAAPRRVNALIERDRVARALQEQVGEKDGVIRSLEFRLEDTRTQIERLSALVAERDQHLTAVAMRNGQIAGLEQTVAEQQRRIANLLAILEAREAEISGIRNAAIELERAAAARDARLATLEQAAAAWEARIAGLAGAIAEREGQIGTLTQSVETWRAEAEESSRQAAESRRAVELREQELMRLSDWAAYIDAHPGTYAVKKHAFRAARTVLRSLPVTVGTKQRLRARVLSVARRIRRRVVPAPNPATAVVAAPAATIADAVVRPERDVLVFAVTDWHFRIQRPQHLARNLARMGRRVFFLSNHFVDSDVPGYEIERLDPSLDLYQVKLHVYGAPSIYFVPPDADAKAMLKAGLARLVADVGAWSTLSLVQHAYWYPLVRSLPDTYRVYDCMDHHQAFGDIPRELIDLEREMLRHADLVTVTSSWLEREARGYTSRVAVVRNGVEYEQFAHKPADVYVDERQRRIIGYYGAIADWFDLDLVRTVALGHRDRLILLVGADTAGAAAALADLPNVVLTGEIPYARLPFYLHAFDVCLLPFKKNPLTLATNPVKVYEYLAAGKPVVSVDLPEIVQFEDLVRTARSADDFVREIELAVREDDAEQARRRQTFASRHTWDHRVAELNEALRNLRLPRISVIVLTYNALDLTKRCLQSLVDETDYPNLEIILVDNASTDGTPDYLHEFARQHAHVHVILSFTNKGFAAGNNAGLAAATGDYLVLLNNDTVVTRGWAMTLMRHLQDDPSIGLIGPVTNNIGNEAMVPMAYQDIADMPAEARRLVLANMGKRFPMRNAAFFCAMLPRSTYERCGPLSEEYGRGFFEDDDYCRRAEAAGLRVFCAEDVFVHHHLSASFNEVNNAERQALFTRNKAIYERRWGQWIPHTYRRQAPSDSH